MEDYELENIEKICIEALTIDGGYHKQWYIEKILFYICGKHKWDELKEKYDWQSGIVP